MTSEDRLSKAPSSHLARFISPVFELQELISQLLLPSELPFALEVVLHLGVEPSTTTQNYLRGRPHQITSQDSEEGVMMRISNFSAFLETNIKRRLLINLTGMTSSYLVIMNPTLIFLLIISLGL